MRERRGAATWARFSSSPVKWGRIMKGIRSDWTAPHPWTRLLGFFQPVPVSAGRMPLTDRSARSGPCCRSRCEVAPRCTTRLENAHNTEFRELLYPWHPWSGLRIGIHEAIERPGGVVFRCDLTASDANRWLEVPAWMFD